MSFTQDYNAELYHYGVKGMKWGVRRAMKFVDKADANRRHADKWDEKAQRAADKGKLNRADKYRQNASDYRTTANKYQSKIDSKAEKKYSKAGKSAGKADYYREKGNAAYEQHERNAKVLDKAAAQYDKQGKVFKAEASRKAAAALRDRGANVRKEQMRIAESYMKSSIKLNEKADSFATQTRCSLGKKKVDSIINSSKKKGYESAKSLDNAQREMELESKLGSNGYEAYNRLRGKS